MDYAYTRGMTEEGWEQVTVNGSRVSNPWLMRDIASPDVTDTTFYNVRQYLFRSYDAANPVDAELAFNATRYAFNDVKNNYLSKGFNTGTVQFGQAGSINIYRTPDDDLDVCGAIIQNGNPILPTVFVKETAGSTPLFINADGTKYVNFYGRTASRPAMPVVYMNLTAGASVEYELAYPVKVWYTLLAGFSTSAPVRPALQATVTYSDGSTSVAEVSSAHTYHWYIADEAIDVTKRVSKVKLVVTEQTGLAQSSLLLNTATGELVDYNASTPSATVLPVTPIDYAYIYSAGYAPSGMPPESVDVTSRFTASTTASPTVTDPTRPVVNITTAGSTGFGLKPNAGTVVVNFVANQSTYVDYMDIVLDTSQVNLAAYPDRFTYTINAKTSSANQIAATGSRTCQVLNSASTPNEVTLRVKLGTVRNNTIPVSRLDLTLARTAQNPVPANSLIIIKHVKIYGQ